MRFPLETKKQSKGLSSVTSVPLRGGNADNGVQCGVAYVNLNNTAGNANWNIRASLTYRNLDLKQNAPLSPCPLAKINPMQAPASSASKAGERIRQ